MSDDAEYRRWLLDDPDAASRQWGAPEELIPFLHWERGRWAPVPAPVVQVNWDDGLKGPSGPPLPLIRDAAMAGAGLAISLGEPFDLADLGDALGHVSNLSLSGPHASLLANSQLIAEMTSLRLLRLVRGLEPVDGSRLTVLTSLLVLDRAQLGLARLPSLTSLNCEMPSLPEDFVVPDGLRSLCLRTRRVDLRSIGDLSGLVDILTDGVETVDLGALARSENITSVRVLRAKSVMNVATLIGRVLDDVVLEEVRHVVDLESVLELDTPVLHASGQGFSPEFVARVDDRSGWWVRPARSPRTRSVFERRKSGQTIELVLHDFDWIAEIIGDDIELHAEDVEALLERAILDDDPSARVRFDSEADAIILTVESAAQARTYSSAVTKFFRSRPAVQHAYLIGRN